MNKSILLLVFPCVVALVMVNAQFGGVGITNQGYRAYPGYPAYYNNQLNSYKAQTRLYNYGQSATASLRGSRLLNYLFGLLLVLDLTNTTGNTLG